jgi:hypothetical protein
VPDAHAVERLAAPAHLQHEGVVALRCRARSTLSAVRGSRVADTCTLQSPLAPVAQRVGAAAGASATATRAVDGGAGSRSARPATARAAGSPLAARAALGARALAFGAGSRPSRLAAARPAGSARGLRRRFGVLPRLCGAAGRPRRGRTPGRFGAVRLAFAARAPSSVS